MPQVRHRHPHHGTRLRSHEAVCVQAARTRARTLGAEGTRRVGPERFGAAGFEAIVTGCATTFGPEGVASVVTGCAATLGSSGARSRACAPAAVGSPRLRAGRAATVRAKGCATVLP